MKNILISLIIVVGCNTTYGQSIDYNLDDGFIANGHDVVAYFDSKVKEGKSAYVLSYKGAKYKFSSEANKAKFKANPAKYAPQYGGWCAYAMASKGEKVTIDPETFEIRGGKLYLFYNSWVTNTKEDWLKEGPEKLKSQADDNWIKIKYKK
jgi:YHS domain-containing protein